MNNTIAGKVVVITGASSGLGRPPPACFQRKAPASCSARAGMIASNRWRTS